MEATPGSQARGARYLFTLPVMWRECHTPKGGNQSPRGPFTLLPKQTCSPGTQRVSYWFSTATLSQVTCCCPRDCLDSPVGLRDLGQELPCLAVATLDIDLEKWLPVLRELFCPNECLTPWKVSPRGSELRGPRSHSWSCSGIPDPLASPAQVLRIH